MIVMSGIDSSGKSTQIALLVKELKNRGKKPLILWSREGYTENFQKLKEIIRRIHPGAIPTSEEKEKRDKMFKNKGRKYLWLYISIIDMMIIYCVKIRVLNLLGYEVICDRYLWDTYIDFKLKFPCLGFENWFLWKLLIFVSVKPNFSILLWLNPEISMQRSIIKKEPFPENAQDRSKRFELYSELKNKDKWSYVIKAENSIENIYNNIKRIIDI